MLDLQRDSNGMCETGAFVLPQTTEGYSTNPDIDTPLFYAMMGIVAVVRGQLERNFPALKDVQHAELLKTLILEFTDHILDSLHIENSNQILDVQNGQFVREAQQIVSKRRTELARLLVA